MGSPESRSKKPVSMRPPFLRTVLTAMVAASIVTVMMGLAKLENLLHHQSPPAITITSSSSSSSSRSRSSSNSNSNSSRSSASLMDPHFQQEVREALEKLGHEASSMRVKMEEGSGHTAAELSAVKKLLRRSVLMQRRTRTRRTRIRRRRRRRRRA